MKDFYYISDLNSKNGTLLNGVRIKSAVLKNKDLIKIGNNELIFFKYI
jgi:pSer/pThr/pTyr-binding forkhead associated (FHA) protein